MAGSNAGHAFSFRRLMDSLPDNSERSSLAFASAITAYLVWGVIGSYFRLITVNYDVDAFTLLANRVVWSLVFLLIVLTLRSDLRSLAKTFRSPRLIGGLAVSSVLIAINWIIFIYAAKTGRLVQASLGYFLTPLLSVLLGVVLLRERLRVGQIAAIAITCVGIAGITYLKAGTMWIPVGLMFSFAFYGLMRKRIVIGPIVGLAVETAILLVPATAFLILYHPAAATPIVPAARALLIAAGVITAVPLILFAYAARRLRLITIGLLQFAGPTVQFFVAIALGEHVSWQEYAAFAVIWLGLSIFAIDSVLGHRARQRDDASISDGPASTIAAPLSSRA